jgi:hypothetical protein
VGATAATAANAAGRKVGKVGHTLTKPQAPADNTTSRPSSPGPPPTHEER